MELWKEFAEKVSSEVTRKGPSGITTPIQLSDFYDRHYDSVFSHIKNCIDLKVRVSITGPLGINRPNGSFADTVRQLYAIADVLIVSPAAILECGTSMDSRFEDLTVDGRSMMGRKGHPGHLICYESSPRLLNLLDEARSLVSSGELIYLPGYSTMESTQGFGWVYPSEDLGNSWAEDVFERQLRLIAQDLYVSRRLDCTHIFPDTLASPLSIAGPASGDPVGVALAQINVPIIQSCSFEVLKRIKEEEHFSFKSLQKAIMDAVAELTTADPDSREFRRLLSKIQREIIDGPLATVTDKVRRLERYTYFRTAGYAVATAGLFLSTFLAPPVAGVLTGTLGSVTVLKIYEELIKLLEQRAGAIKDSQNTYICRLAGL